MTLYLFLTLNQHQTPLSQIVASAPPLLVMREFPGTPIWPYNIGDLVDNKLLTAEARCHLSGCREPTQPLEFSKLFSRHPRQTHCRTLRWACSGSGERHSGSVVDSRGGCLDPNRMPVACACAMPAGTSSPSRARTKQMPSRRANHEPVMSPP